MPRNEAKPLSSDDYITQTVMHRRIMAVPTGEPVRLEYTKRNGEKSSSTGPVLFFNGKPGYDTGSVTLDTPDKGRSTTVNIHRIISVTPQ